MYFFCRYIYIYIYSLFNLYLLLIYYLIANLSLSLLQKTPNIKEISSSSRIPTPIHTPFINNQVPNTKLTEIVKHYLRSQHRQCTLFFSFFLSLFLSLSFSLSLFLSLSLSLSLTHSLSLTLSISIYIFLFFYVSVHLSICTPSLLLLPSNTLLYIIYKIRY